jgi:hypothetical protein
LPDPGGTHLLAQRADGFSALPTVGGTRKRSTRQRPDQRAELVRKSLIRSASSAGCSMTMACEASAS